MSRFGVIAPLVPQLANALPDLPALPAAPATPDYLRQVQSVLQAVMNTDEMRKLLREAQADEERRAAEERQRKAAERQGSDMGRLTDTQAAHVLSRPDANSRTSALGTMNMVDRHRKLRAAGLDPQAGWVQKVLGGQRPGESDADYIARARAAKTQWDTQKAAAVQKNRLRGAQAKDRKAASGKVGTAYAVRALPGQDRNARGRGLVHGTQAPDQEGDVELAQKWMDNPDRLPPTPTRYQPVTKIEDQPTEYGRAMPNVDMARDEGEGLLMNGLQRPAAQAVRDRQGEELKRRLALALSGVGVL